jgi:hypothetical protein
VVASHRNGRVENRVRGRRAGVQPTLAGHVGVDGSSDRHFHAACQDKRSGLDPLTNRNLGLDLGVINLVDKPNFL